MFPFIGSQKLKKFSCSMLLLTLLLMIFPVSVFAQNEVSTLEDLKQAIKMAMDQRKETIAIVYKGNTSSLQADLTKIIENLFAADDYLHYSTKSYAFSAAGYVNNVTIQARFSYWESLSDLEFVNRRVSEILSSIITPGMNDFEKEKVIHDWIVKNVAYDTTLSKHSAYAGLSSPYQTVCQGYSLLAYKMLNTAGIPTKILEGYANGEPHNWLMLNLEGTWYHLDITWNDPVPDLPGRVQYDYFNLTDAQMRKANHVWIKDYPVANTPFSNTLQEKISDDPAKKLFYEALMHDLGYQYLLPAYSFTSVADLKNFLQNNMGNKKAALSFRYTRNSSLATDLKNALEGTSAITSYTYTSKAYVPTEDTNDAIIHLNLDYASPETRSALNQSYTPRDPTPLQPQAASISPSQTYPSAGFNAKPLLPANPSGGKNQIKKATPSKKPLIKVPTKPKTPVKNKKAIPVR